MMASAERLRWQWKAERLHALGPRVLAEALMEVAQRTNLELVQDVLDPFERLTRGQVCAAGGDRFPPACFHGEPL